jgi:hypothetical protein
MPTTTEQQVAKVADAIRAAAAAYNAAAEEAVRLKLRVELRTIPLRTLMGDVDLIDVRIYEPR